MAIEVREISSQSTYIKEGLLTLYTGPMTGGKTTALINSLRQAEESGKVVLAVKPEIDTRYDQTSLVTHNGLLHPAFQAKNADEIEKLRMKICPDVLAIDELMMYPIDIVDAITEWKSSGLNIYTASLDYDFRKDPFEVIKKLKPVVDNELIFTAKCFVCHGAARWTQRLYKGVPASRHSPLIIVGGINSNPNDYSYEARCDDCHILPD